MTSTPDLVERLREEAERLSGHSIDRGSVDAGLAANLANEAADRLESLSTETRVGALAAIADIREVTGLGAGPMLGELAGAVKALLSTVERERDEARALNEQNFGRTLVGANQDLREQVARLTGLVEQAFRDGMVYATNVRVTDPDEAWRTSRARSALQAEKKP